MDIKRLPTLLGILLLVTTLPAAANKFTHISGGFSGSTQIKVEQLRELIYWTGIFFMGFGGFLGLFHRRLGIHIPVGLVVFGVLLFAVSFLV